MKRGHLEKSQRENGGREYNGGRSRKSLAKGGTAKKVGTMGEAEENTKAEDLITAEGCKKLRLRRKKELKKGGKRKERNWRRRGREYEG